MVSCPLREIPATKTFPAHKRQLNPRLVLSRESVAGKLERTRGIQVQIVRSGDRKQSSSFGRVERQEWFGIQGMHTVRMTT
jgi:hypothetical protein